MAEGGALVEEGELLEEELEEAALLEDEAAAVTSGMPVEPGEFPGIVPAGAKSGWVPRIARTGKGMIWQDPSVPEGDNSNSIRIMYPTARHPNGYVRFYNMYNQPIVLNGKPGSNSVTHIPINPDGTYPLPLGW